MLLVFSPDASFMYAKKPNLAVSMLGRLMLLCEKLRLDAFDNHNNSDTFAFSLQLCKMFLIPNMELFLVLAHELQIRNSNASTFSQLPTELNRSSVLFILCLLFHKCVNALLTNLQLRPISRLIYNSESYT